MTPEAQWSQLFFSRSTMSGGERSWSTSGCRWWCTPCWSSPWSTPSSLRARCPSGPRWLAWTQRGEHVWEAGYWLTAGLTSQTGNSGHLVVNHLFFSPFNLQACMLGSQHNYLMSVQSHDQHQPNNSTADTAFFLKYEHTAFQDNFIQVSSNIIHRTKWAGWA